MKRSPLILLVLAVLFNSGLISGQDSSGEDISWEDASGEAGENLLLAGGGEPADPSIETVNVFPAALLKGVIGFTTGEMSQMKDFSFAESKGGCRWFGTAPFCSGKCPDDYEQIRTHDGRCFRVYDKLFKDSCMPDPSFGACCHFKTYKAFCCKRKVEDCSWSGNWTSTAETEGRTLTGLCFFNPGKLFSPTMDWNSCGSIKFSGGGMDQKKLLITGKDCDQLELKGLEGRAACGLITWHNRTTGEVVHKWYKN